jgi:hypothetical protein
MAVKFYGVLDNFGYPLCDSCAEREGLRLGIETKLDCYSCEILAEK